jgi:hypothetical protein
VVRRSLAGLCSTPWRKRYEQMMSDMNSSRSGGSDNSRASPGLSRTNVRGPRRRDAGVIKIFAQKMVDAPIGRAEVIGQQPHGFLLAGKHGRRQARQGTDRAVAESGAAGQSQPQIDAFDESGVRPALVGRPAA